MEKLYDIVMNSSDVPDNYKYYWGYMYRLGEASVVPYAINTRCFKPGDSVMEIGSAEGGVLHAFVNHGAVNATGTDIAQNRLDMGKTISALMGMDVEYEAHNIITEDVPEKWIGKFDLVLLRDVIEHLDDTFVALDRIKKMLKPGGFLFVTFPPYYSPFGGHQHTVGNFGGKFPFIHLLPNLLFYPFLKGGNEGDIGEVKRLQNIKLTTKKFEKAAMDSGYDIFKKENYLLRPVFKMKFGLPEIKLTKLAFLPLVKNIVSMEALYILRKI